MDIELLGKGAVPQPVDPRDFQIASAVKLVPVDWNAGMRLPDPGNEDQGSSSTCVSQATSYYHVQINPANYSRRDLYARIFLPQGGAYLRDGAYQIINKGQATRDEVPDPSPQTEINMRDKTGVNDQVEASHKEMFYFYLPSDIEWVAASVRDYKGAVIGVTGSNPGWADMENPRPPKFGEKVWGHALYAEGYHLHDGVKCIICKSSWCDVVTEHHIKQNYFASGNTFDNITMMPKGTIKMLVFFQVIGSSTVWLLADGQWVGFSDMPAFGKYVDGRPNTIIQIGQTEFDKLKKNVDVFKS